MEREHFVTAFATGTPPVEFFSLEKNRLKLVLSEDLDLKDTVRDITDSARFWLPIAAEKLNISKKLEDYILTPIISMPSDLPNRNQQAFPLQSLTGWCVDAGKIAYKTWEGMPSHIDHQNSDPTKAKGVILECMLKPINNSNGDLWKVVKLVGWDRTRDPILASDILSGKRNCYSMGAHARDFSCSVCATLLSQGGCEHITHGKPDFRVYAGKLAYYNIIDPKGFEISNVRQPAFFSASNTPFFSWV